MIVYSLTYLINSFGAFMQDPKNSRTIKTITVILLIFMSGTRYYMGGSDVYIYEGVYNRAPSVAVVLQYLFTGVNNGVNTNYETGYLLINSLIKSLGFSFWGFSLIFATMFYLLLMKGLEDFVPNWSIFFAIFMYKLMFYDTFISIRQGFTLAVFCLSLKYIRDGKWLKYFICCIIAFYIHRGAIFLFPLYFVRYIPMSKGFLRTVAILFLPTWLIRGRVNIGGIIESIISIIGFANKSEGWAEATEPISIIHTLELYIIIVLVLMFYEKIINNEREAEAKLALQIFVVAIPIFTLLSNWIVMTREKDYIVLMYGILIGMIVDGGTTMIQEYDDGYYPQNSVGYGNATAITTLFLIACYIGMIRYVLVFDGGVMKHFTSFFFKEGAHIFNW